MKNAIVKILILSSLFGVFKIKALAQIPSTNSNGQVRTVQPKIMVVPFAKEGEDIRTVLEADVDRRIAITKTKEAFDARGFTTVDFVGKLKAISVNKGLSDNQSDIKTQIIENSGADIYVEVEVKASKGQTGSSVSLILTAYEASTGNSLANKVGQSGRFYTDDFGKLASRAVESVAEEFLNVMQTKFSEIVENGKSISVEIGFDENSQYDMFSEFGASSMPLADLLEEWMGKNAFKNNYHIQGTSDKKIIFDDVRIPLKDQITGVNYNTNRFAAEIFKYLKTLSLNSGRTLKGNTIIITIK
jgi:hypothetical protein